MPKSRSKTALILAGGGIMGAAYEIGCLVALDRLFQLGFSSRRFDTFIGVSAGSVIAALIANRIQPSGLFKTISRNERTVFNWNRRDIYRFDWWSSIRSCLQIPFNFIHIWKHYRQRNWHFTLSDLPHLIQEQFPAGLFSLDPLQNYLCSAFRNESLCDDFNTLRNSLLIPAYDLDTGERVVFGSPGHTHPHICQAITASCAIPFFFQPYRIGSRAYLDGSTGKASHLDLAIEQGAKLIVIINPRVPFYNDPKKACLPSVSYGQCSKIDDLGILFTWEQSQRIGTQSFLHMDVENYRQKHPGIDILLFEPGPEEALFFLQGPMSISARNQVMHHGYHLTLYELRQNYVTYQEVFARHGINTDQNRLENRHVD
ncbi:MAG: patatin-like phospholipase family protein [Deltaproteobacteria bacterium]|jgi:predicted acylesterase/phospholipase RssA|nr:patatin-like phospholipase family protein [Deltaproteobacteria bacterium]MBW2477104.1 patatin-like phospholipase family protein [Deltaproteobacteria bacterium]MBW2519499.1 patatin-like phospholipase family protein [Deltaproteobacteria bacterium]